MSRAHDPCGGADLVVARQGVFGTIASTWVRSDWIGAAALLGVIALMHAVAFAVLFGVVGPAHYTVGTQVLGVGLGLTAYTYGLRHAFDADHLAAIDNATRKLRGDGRRPKSVGFWFAMGHSAVVAGMAALVAAGAHIIGDLTTDGSTTKQALGLVSGALSGAFLYAIAILNLSALVGITRVFRASRNGEVEEDELEAHLQARGFFNRILGGLTQAITRPGQMFAVGLLFGLGFDTATEVALLVLAGTGAAGGVPWYAVMVLPLLFACGMSLFDCADGLFMSVAYDWAFLNPVRKVYYNLSITGLSVAVAFLIGTIELVGVLHDNAGFKDPVTNWISGVDLNNVGFVVVGLFMLTWIGALTYWHVAKVEDRWAGSSGELNPIPPS